MTFEEHWSQHVATRKAAESFRESIREYVRTDHLWLYELIANPRMMVQRQAHWKRS